MLKYSEYLPGLYGGFVSTEQTSGYSATNKDLILADTSGGIFTVTLAASPSIGDEIIIIDVAGTFSAYNLTIDRNGNKILGQEDNFVCDVDDLWLRLVYTGATNGWRVSIDGLASIGGNTVPWKDWVSKATAFNAESWGRYKVDTSGGSITATLPASPITNDEIKFIDLRQSFGTNSLILGRNGNNIMGSADDVEITLDNYNFTLLYADATSGWVVT